MVKKINALLRDEGFIVGLFNTRRTRRKQYAVCNTIAKQIRFLMKKAVDRGNPSLAFRKKRLWGSIPMDYLTFLGVQ